MSDLRSMQDMFNGTVDVPVNRQPTPLFLADALDADARSPEIKQQAASELRRLYSLCVQLEEELNAKPAREPLTDEWVPVTQSLLSQQHPWLYQPMWIAMKGGVVVQGYYEWRQGRNPDRFITELGDEWAFNADCVMPLVKPAPPPIEAAHGIGEKK